MRLIEIPWQRRGLGILRDGTQCPAEPALPEEGPQCSKEDDGKGDDDKTLAGNGQGVDPEQCHGFIVGTGK